MSAKTISLGQTGQGSKFDSFALDSRIVAGIPRDYLNPTQIQSEAIPLISDGRDVLGLAQTGTGKTAAFILPLLNRLLRQRDQEAVSQRNHNHNRGHALRALILAPTRELAEQICENIKVLGAKTGLRHMSIYGGVNMNPQIQRLRQGVDIVVACPGRLLDHMQQRTIDLRRVELLVLDEADQMFDMGFLPNVRRIVKALTKERQTLLFSATMPEDVRHLANEVLQNPVTVQVGLRKPVSTVSHSIFVVPGEVKSALLFSLLKETGPGSVLVFTRTKHGAKRLGLALSRKGYAATSLEGNMSQRQRQDAITGFRNGKFQILVATDIAARGIDVQSVSHVINFDIPSTVDAYTHRIGRTGRAERTGDAFTFVTRADMGMLRMIERALGGAIERRALPTDLPEHSDAEAGRGDRSMTNRHASSDRDPARRHGSARTRSNDRGADRRGTGRRAAASGRGNRPPHAVRGEDRQRTFESRIHN